MYGILVLAIVTVFVGGLMVGRTPEYLGKKIRPTEMKYAALYFLTLPVLILTAAGLSIAMKTPAGLDSQSRAARPDRDHVRLHLDGQQQRLGLRGPDHGDDWYNTVGGIVMLLGRFAPEIFALGLAGSLARQQPCRPARARWRPTSRCSSACSSA